MVLLGYYRIIQDGSYSSFQLLREFYVKSAADSLLKKKDDKKYPYSETFLVFFLL